MADPDPELLREAGDLCRRAAAALDGGPRDELYDHATQFETLATLDRSPDHGRLDRHMSALHRIAGDVEGDASEAVSAARDRLREYRLDLDGV